METEHSVVSVRLLVIGIDLFGFLIDLEGMETGSFVAPVCEQVTENDFFVLLVG